VLKWIFIGQTYPLRSDLLFTDCINVLKKLDQLYASKNAKSFVDE